MLSSHDFRLDPQVIGFGIRMKDEVVHKQSCSLRNLACLVIMVNYLLNPLFQIGSICIHRNVITQNKDHYKLYSKKKREQRTPTIVETELFSKKQFYGASKTNGLSCKIYTRRTKHRIQIIPDR
jgi:hypothetical protein